MNNQISLLNRGRRAIRARMAKDAKKYAETSAKLLAAMEKLSKDDLSAFLKKNPDMLLDIGGGAVAKVGSKVKAVAAFAFRELKKDLAEHGAKGAKKAGTLKEKLENKGLEYIKKILSF